MKWLAVRKEGLKKLLASFFFLIASVCLLLMLVWGSYYCFVNAAPGIYEIPNPVSKGVKIVEVEEWKRSEIKEKKEEFFSNFSSDKDRVLVMVVKPRALIFWKFGDVPGEVKKYSHPLISSPKILFRSMKKLDVGTDTIQVRYQWDILGFFAVALMIGSVSFLVYRFVWRNFIEAIKLVLKP